MTKAKNESREYHSMSDYWLRHPSPTREEGGKGSPPGADVGSRLADQFLKELKRSVAIKERKGSHN